MTTGRPTGKHAPGVRVTQRVKRREEVHQRQRLLLGEVIEGRYIPRDVLDQRDCAHLRFNQGHIKHPTQKETLIHSGQGRGCVQAELLGGR